MNCRTCDTPLGARNRTGLCIVCGNRARYQSAEFRERQRAGIRRAEALDPARVAARKARLIATATSPEGRELRSRLAKERGQAAIGRAAMTNASRTIAGMRRTETLLGDIAPKYRDLYRHLVRSSRLSAAEARGMIADMERRDLAQLRRKMGAGS